MPAAEEVKSKLIKRETIKLRYIEDILYDLKDRGTVAQEKPFGRYFLTDKIFEDAKFTASILGKNATSKIKYLNALEQNPFVKVDDNNFEKCYIDAYSLFAFANNIGALIVYAMLDIMKSDTMKHLAKGIEKDQFVQDKINNFIAPERILGEFCKIELVKRGQSVGNVLPLNKSLSPEVRSEILSRQRRARRFDPRNPAWSRYEMDYDSFEKAMQAFRRVYPSVLEELEKIKNDLPNTIQLYRKSFVRSVKKNKGRRNQK